MRNRRNGRRGFTLIEVLMVLAIIGLLASVAIVALVPAGEGAKKKTSALLLKSVKTALSLYNNDIGHYPSEEEGGLEALRTKPNFSDEKIAEKWNGPYLEEEPRDAWSNKLNYQLTPPGTPEYQQTPYKLWSNGPDGMDGTADDIKNWSDETTTK
jgi:general secretion pathway protein G